MTMFKRALIGFMVGGYVGFFGWLLSGWQYLKGHVPFAVWDNNIVSAIPADDVRPFDQ